ncbi:MAG: phosphoribosylformylglycinamidine synthase subunit PurS [Candidatus Micrarchaeia archaeon]
MKYKVEITYKPGVLDPEGKSTLDALKTLGFNVSNVQSMKAYIIECNYDEKKIDEMCRKLLSNPIIHNYSIQKL